MKEVGIGVCVAAEVGEGEMDFVGTDGARVCSAVKPEDTSVPSSHGADGYPSRPKTGVQSMERASPPSTSPFSFGAKDE